MVAPKLFSLASLTEILSFGRIVEQRSDHEVHDMQPPLILLRYGTKRGEVTALPIVHLLHDPPSVLSNIKFVF